MKLSKTNRGFGRTDFVDSYGIKCSLQESSNGECACIWLGSDDTNPEVMTASSGWQKLLAEGDIIKINPLVGNNTPTFELLFHGRMHLNQKQVKALLPHLQKFAKTGRL